MQSRISSSTSFLKWLAALIPPISLALLSACGGGSSSTSTQPPPGNPINNVCNSGTFSGSPASSTPNTYFGMHIHDIAQGTPPVPWPSTISLPGTSDTVQFGGLRLWDSGTGWAEMNTAAGTCDFSHMDDWVSEAQSNNADILYNLGRTPNWASSDPSDSSCAYADDVGGNGQCWPPTDLNSDGSGADSIWIGWVTSVVSRYKGQIKYYEIWNEWNISLFWKGTPQQLVRMTQDARCVIEGPPAAGGSCNSDSTFPNGTGLDPNARIITPSPVGSQSNLNAAETNMATYLGAQAGGMGPASFVDVIGFHCYVSTQTVGDYPIPEQVLTVIDDLNSILPNFPVQGDPVFCTEGGYGQVNLEGFTDPDLQAGFLARFYLLQASTNVSRVYWYAWDQTSTDTGALWSSTTGPTEAATAYAEVYRWITGATPSACTQNGNVWSCVLTRSGGYQALAVWDGDTGSSCYTSGAPTCTTFSIPGQYTLYRDLSGNETAVPGATIGISAKPILLETSALP